MKYLPLLVVLACGGSQASSVDTPTATPRTPYEVASGDLQAAIAGPHRTEDERARDRFRKPAETLEHFGVRPDMTVLEIWPGGGWYTKILAPYLRDQGRLIAANMDPEDDTFRGEFARNYLALLDSAPELYDRVERRVLWPGKLLDGVPDQSVDFALSPRNTHNWIRNEGHSAADYFAAVFRVLKPDGTFGVIQHRAPEGTEHGEDGTIGYLTESVVIRLAEAAGFELAERSELHANEADTHDHPNGVWSLPPALRGGDENREHFVAIGESDRMTLTFRRPAPRHRVRAPDEARARSTRKRTPRPSPETYLFLAGGGRRLLEAHPRLRVIHEARQMHPALERLLALGHHAEIRDDRRQHAIGE